MGQSAQEETGAASENGHATTRANLGDPGAREIGEPSRVEALVGSDDIEAVMRHAAALRERRLRRADVHAAVDLARVQRDDFAVETEGDFDGYCGLSGRGGARDDECILSHDGRNAAPAPRAKDGSRWVGRARRGTAGPSRTGARTAPSSPRARV